MEDCRLRQISILVFAVGCAALPSSAHALELGPLVTIDGAVLGIVQHGRYNNTTTDDNMVLDQESGGAGMVDLEIDVSPTPTDTFWARVRFAVGNALSDVGGLELPPYNGPLEDDVKNVNESGRDYLLEGWYRHTFTISSKTQLAVTGGIIDSTNYIDDNRYANDEDTQFMSPAFSTPDNRPGAPSYDPGVALELQGDGWSLNGVYMDTSNETSDDIDYLGIQAAYHDMSATRPGNYRILAYTAEGRLKDSKAQSGRVRMLGLGVSIDQELGKDWGIFFRAFMQNDDAPVVYDKDVSGGISIGGRHWGRPDDTLGIAYARLIGSGRQKIDHSDIAEAYVKFRLLRSIDFTVDVQYQKDHTDSVKGNPQAWILGGRLNFEF